MDILQKTKIFYTKFKGEKAIIGKSLFGRPIYSFTVKKTDYPQIIIQYAIHAREYITTYLALKQMERFDACGKVGTIYFLPIMNPDGVSVALNSNPLYKANGRGVDLNVNFDARWGTGEKNVNVSGDENYIGSKPFSEPETVALKDFTLFIKPDATISYHSKGEEIYWEFFQPKECSKRDYSFAKAISEITGYAIKSTQNSAGGYKDWCIEKLKIPALTIEVGRDELSHPIGKEYINEIYQKNKRVPETATEYLWGKLCK